MEKLKIKAKNLDQKNEIINLFILLGYKEDSSCTYNNDDLMGIHVYRDGDIQDVLDEDYSLYEHKEITLPELRSLVSLHKNPINMDKVLNDVRSDALGLLEDKEWLNTKTYEYKKAVDMGGHGKWIEIPEGADVATSLKFVIGAVSFLKRIDDSFLLWSEQVGEWGSKKYKTITRAVGDNKVLWQRQTHPEELPFVDGECYTNKSNGGFKLPKDKPCDISKWSELRGESLNDQYAEIEQVRQASITDTLKDRQSTYGDFSMVAEMTQGLLFVMSEYGYNDMPDTHKESIHMIASKLARIINGNHDHKDSWHDIAGYATLVEQSL